MTQEFTPQMLHLEELSEIIPGKSMQKVVTLGELTPVKPIMIQVTRLTQIVGVLQVWQ